MQILQFLTLSVDFDRKLNLMYSIVWLKLKLNHIYFNFKLM